MYEVNFIAAKNQPRSWSGVYGYRPETEDELKNKGELLIVMALSTPQDFQLENLAGMLFDEIQQAYFETKYTKPLSQLETSVEAMSKRIDMIIEREPELLTNGLDLQCAISIIVGDTAFVAVVGESKITLVRDGKLVRIDTSLQDTTGKGFLRSGSFRLESGSDTLFLLTEKADYLVSQAMLGHISETLDLESLHKPNEEGFAIALVASEERIKLVADMRAEEEREATAEAERIEREELARAKTLRDRERELARSQAETELAIDPETDAESDLEIEPETVVIPARRIPVSDSRRVVTPNSDTTETATSRLLSRAKLVSASVVAKATELFASAKVRLAGYEIGRKFTAATKNISAKLVPDDQSEAKTYQVLLGRVTRVLRNVWTTIVRFVRKNLLGNEAVGNRGMYLKGGRRPNRNWRLIAVIVVVVGGLLYVVVSNAVDNSNQQSLRLAATNKLKEKHDKADQIATEVSSVIVGVGNEQAKIAKIADITNLGKEVQAIDLKPIRETKDLTTQKQEIAALLDTQIDRLRGIKLIKDPTLIADLGVNFQNVKASDMDVYQGNVYVSDQNNSAIYKIPTKAAATPIKFATDKLSRPNAIKVDDAGNLIVFDEDTQSSISTVNLTDGSVQKHVGGLNTANVGIPNNIATYKLGEDHRLYWIDNSSNELKWVRRSPVGGYGSSPSTRRTDPDYATSRDMTVFDGKIYVLSPEKGLLRYFSDGSSSNRLVPDSYTLTGLLPDDTLTNSSAMDIVGNEIYIGDSNKHRIVVLSRARNGTDTKFVDFQSQLVYRGTDDKFKNIKEVIYNDQDKFLYILDGVKIYRINPNDN